MKPCELCNTAAARMFCAADAAALCWECDEKVHAANFLVARHSRSLLCRRCQEQTPWSASGSHLGRTVSVCDRCSAGEVEERGCNGRIDDSSAGAVDRETARGRSCGGWIDDSSENEGDDEEESDGVGDEEESEVEEDEKGENRVVSWEEEPDMTFSATTPPPMPSCSSSGESCSAESPIRRGFSKRKRGNAASSSYGQHPQPDRQGSSPLPAFADHSCNPTEQGEDEGKNHDEDGISSSGDSSPAPAGASRRRRTRRRRACSASSSSLTI